jgi:hypothetical protein
MVDDRKVPLILPYLLDHLSRTWLTEPGLFRISGGHSEMQALKASFDFETKFPPLDPAENGGKVVNPHAVSGLIKMYLRELPDCLLTCELYDTWLNAAMTDDHNALPGIVRLLPAQNRAVLERLLSFLVLVEAQKEENHMTADNLAICFAPTLLRRDKPSLADVKNAKPLIAIIAGLIRQHQASNPIPNPTVDASAAASGQHFQVVMKRVISLIAHVLTRQRRPRP